MPIALLLTATLCAAQVTVQVQPNPIFVGEPGQYVITSAIGSPRLQQFPRVAGVTWSNRRPSTSNNIRWVNGRQSATHTLTYIFNVNRAGRFVIPATRIQVGNRTVHGRAITVEARKRQFPSGGKQVDLEDLIFMEVTYNGEAQPPKEIYLGQEVTITIRLYVVQDVQIFWNSFKDVRNFFPRAELANAIFRDYSEQNEFNHKFLYKDPGQPQYEIRDGRRHQVMWYQTSVSALEVGRISGSIEHAVPIQVQDRQSQKPRRSRSMWDFDSIFDRGRLKIHAHPVRVNIPTITVKSVPMDDGVAGEFIGLIGNWTINFGVDQPEVEVGKDVTLTLRVNGSGNIAALKAPALADKFPGFRVFQPEIQRQTDRNGLSLGLVKWVVVPLNADSQLPVLKVKTFDAATGSFKAHTLRNKLNVKPSQERLEKGIAVADFSQYMPGVPTIIQGREKQRADDILHIKQVLGAYLYLPLWRNVYFYLVAFGAGGPLACLIIWLVAVRREKLRGSESYRRRRDAVQRRGRVFRRVRKASGAELPDVIREELVPYLVAMLDLPPGTTSTELVSKIDEPELVDMLRSAETGGFMPGNNTTIDADRLLRKVKTLAAIVLVAVMTRMVPAFAAADKASVLRSYDDPFTAAAAAYERERVDEAAAIYSQLDQAGQGNASIEFNLGNCAYRNGEYGMAVVHYERARRLAPRDSDITENLNFVRGQLNLSPIDISDDPIAMIGNLRDKLRPDEWALGAGMMWLLAWLVFAIGRWRRTSYRLVPLLPAAACLICLWACFAQLRGTYRTDQAVVVSHESPVYRLPQQGADSAKMVLDAGVYVEIVESRIEWTRIRIDQAEGWVKNTAIDVIWN